MNATDSDADCDGDHDEGDRESIIAPSPLLFVLAFLMGVVLDRVRREGSGGRRFPRLPNTLVGVLSIVAGTVLGVGAIREMQRAGTGPSHGDDPPELITTGVFRYSRNPIYLGNCLQYVGLALLYDSPWPLASVVPVLAYLDRVVDREETCLEATFGEEFETYRENTRRWF